jgi:acetyl esterase/lipase
MKRQIDRDNQIAFAVALLSLISSVAVCDDGKQVPGDIELKYNIAYREGDSKSWRLDLAIPKRESPKPRPALLVIHGGGWIEGDKSSFSTPQVPVPGNIIDCAKMGFVAATMNYRLAGEATYPAALDDCRCAVRWLRAHAKDYNIDVDHIGAWGNSAGGHLAFMLALTDDPTVPGDPWSMFSSRVQSAVSDSGPLDMVYQHEQGTLRTVVERFLGGPPDGDRVDVYKFASPIHRISKKAPPLLLIYGVADNQVPVETADKFVLAAGAAGLNDVSYCRLAGIDHCPHSLQRVTWLPAVVNEFFLRTLRPNRTSAQ